MRTGLFAGVLALGLVSATRAQEAATAEHPVLVELFTSEGCSSCPPADAVLRKLHEMHTPGGATMVTLSEHVTYWNHDGWVDQFSQDTFTSRQAAYAEEFKKEPYTPQVVVNGVTELLGSDGNGILKAVDAARTTAVTVKIVSVQVMGKKVEVTYSVVGDLPKKGADVYLAVTDDEATTAVRGGENQGRTISHVSVARSLDRVATVKDGAERMAKASLPAAGGGHHVVLIAQETGLGKVLAVESKAL